MSDRPSPSRRTILGILLVFAAVVVVSLVLLQQPAVQMLGTYSRTV